MNIAMSQFGSSLSTRSSGRAAYKLISDTLKDAHEVVAFDFSGIGSITNSFADESFGRLAGEMGIEALKSKTTFKNIDRNSALLIRMAMDRRIRCTCAAA